MNAFDRLTKTVNSWGLVISSGLAMGTGAEGLGSATGVADLEPPADCAGPRVLGALMGERSLAGVDGPTTLSGRAMVVRLPVDQPQS